MCEWLPADTCHHLTTCSALSEYLSWYSSQEKAKLLAQMRLDEKLRNNPAARMAGDELNRLKSDHSS